MASVEEIKEIKKKKVAALRAGGVNPYPETTGDFLTVKEALAEFASLEKSKKEISIAGRIMLLRPQGGLAFGQAEDETGRLQVFLNKQNLGEDKFTFFIDNFEVGDIVKFTGAFFSTKRGEKTIEVRDYKILTKALRPLPEKWHGLQDVEKKLRYRYLDLLLDREAREIFYKKAVFWDSAREFLKGRGFLEVETPAFEAIPGGAEAEPFITHYNALDQDLYLRISLELPLKRLLVGGFEKVFEIGRVFRNEGMDAAHLQDYTALEFYWAYHDLDDLKKMVREFYQFVIEKTLGGLKHSCGETEIDWSGDWPDVDYFDLFEKNVGLDLNDATDEQLRAKIKDLRLKTDLDINKLGRGRMIDLLYKKTCRPGLVKPCFLTGHPLDISPLSKKDAQNPNKVLRIQPLAGGAELGNGFAELNDPQDQKERFEAQMKLRESGDKEAQMMDEDFVEALEYGMPPAAGFGLSERLFAFIVDKPVRETTLFPAVRKEE